MKTDNRRDIQYDTDTFLKYTQTIYKTHDEEGNELTTPQKVSSIVFDNKYSVTSTEFTVPSVYKKLTGDTRPEEKEFTFTLTPKDGAPEPSMTTVTITGEGSGVFGDIVFDKIGTYVYEITEDDTDYAGYTKDEAVYTYTVTVTDNNGQLEAEGKLTKQTDDADKMTFTNDYTPVPTELEVPVAVKKITGHERPTEKEFTFEIKASGENVPMPEKTTATVTGEGTATAFGKIAYDKIGTYTYTVFERDLDDSYVGYTKDEAVYTLTVTVVDDDGNLKASYIITKEDEEQTGFVFDNGYIPMSVDAELEIEKVLKGTVDTIKDTYTFVLKGKDSAPVPDKNTVDITGQGKAAFDKWTYTKAGVYSYEVVEQAGGAAGCTYDKTVFIVVDTVTDDDGKLTVSRKITAGGKDAKSVVFENTYEEYNPSTGNTSVPTTSFGALLLIALVLCVLKSVKQKNKTL